MMAELGHGWGMGWWWIIGIIALALIIWLLVGVTNQKPNANLPGNKSSLDILKDKCESSKEIGHAIVVFGHAIVV